MIRSPLRFGRKRRKDLPLAGTMALDLPDDARLFGYTLLSGLVFFAAYLG